MTQGVAGRDADVLVLGGGAAGVAFRAALPEGREATLLEAGPELGGLMRMHRRGPYTFDTVPHVIFFRSRRLLAAVSEMLGGEMRSFPRSNSIWQHGRLIPYPYQYNAHALPDDVRRDCLDGFRDNPHRGEGRGGDATFEAWLRGEFGPGFLRHFFRPYNEKLYGVPLHELEAAPLRWTIPAENAEAVEAGAADTSLQHYPTGRGGICRVVTGLAGLGRGEIATGCAAVRVDPARREVHTSTGEAIRYRTLVSSLPLRETLRLLGPEGEAAGEALHALSITVTAVGARATGPGLPDIWTYFPEGDVPFYRLTRLERLSPELAPPGGAALLLESPGTEAPPQDEVVEWLHRHGVVPREAVEHVESWCVPYAYVLFRRGYREARARALRVLAGHGIASIGRYGAWMYADIEMTIKSGVSAARRLEGGGGPASGVAGWFAA